MSYPRLWGYGVGEVHRLATDDWNYQVKYGNRMPASIIIDYDSPDYLAVEGKYGRIVYGGPHDTGGVDGGDAPDVLEAAATSVQPGGGIISFRPGVYGIDRIVDFTDMSLVLRGSGVVNTADGVPPTAGTVLRLTGAATKLLNKEENLGNPRSKKSLEISDLIIDGNGFSTIALGYFSWFENLTLRNIVVRKAVGNGVTIDRVANVKLLHSEMLYNGYYGMNIQDCPGVKVFGGDYSTNGADGLRVASVVSVVEDIQIIGAKMVTNGWSGLHFYRTAGISNNVNTVLGCHINENQRHGIHLESATNSPLFLRLLDNILTDNGFGHNGYSALYMDNVGEVEVRGNYLGRMLGTGEQDYGITFVNNPYNIIVRQNRIHNNRLGTILGTAVTSVIRDNDGHITENSGLSTGTGAEQTIAHGLAATPNRVYFSNIEDGANPYQSSPADATNIYVTAVAGKDYVWRAEIV